MEDATGIFFVLDLRTSVNSDNTYFMIIVIVILVIGLICGCYKCYLMRKSDNFMSFKIF